MNLFAYPWMLLGSIPAALIIIYFFCFKPQPGIVVSDAEYLPTRRWFCRRTAPWISGILSSLALLLIVAALARPRLGDEKLVLRSQGIDMMMVLDLSGSMGAIDVPESITTRQNLEQALNNNQLKTRLDSAKSELVRFINARPNDRIGLIGFAEYGYTFSPPTLDHNWLTAALEPLKPGIIGDATGIASPVASAIKRLDKSTAPRRVLVLFTDGKNNVSHRLTPLETAELAKEKDIIIYTVGIGNNNAYMLQEGFFGKQFVRYPGEFDEKLLQQMAAVTGGKYFRAADENGMAEVMQEINKLEKTSFEQPRYVEYREFAPALAAIALVMLMLACCLENSFELTAP